MDRGCHPRCRNSTTAKSFFFPAPIPLRKTLVKSAKQWIVAGAAGRCESKEERTPTCVVMDPSTIYALVDYEDPYVEPLLRAALQARLPPELLHFIQNAAELPQPSSRFLQWRQYESIDFEALMEHSTTSLANSYIIRKALIRKHYLSTTVAHWATKNPQTCLKAHIQPSVEFEVDYAEFLDDALLEAYELKESWDRNAAVADASSKEWWILKPGMSERGQGIRLFSSEAELEEIFSEWDPPSDDEEDEAATADDAPRSLAGGGAHDERTAKKEDDDAADDNGIITSQLRHFVAQPYIHPPLLLPLPHASAGRKFHIRTYVLATGALKVYVYKEMLALFAAEPYASPSSSSDEDGAAQQINRDLARHLTNTCLQDGTREGAVHAFWSLPEQLPGLEHQADWRTAVFEQIGAVTGELFEAAARSMAIHFQALPNAFEIFGLDFLIDARGTAWLLEVNAFPDFAQTGAELQELIAGLFREVVDVAVAPFFEVEKKGVELSPGKMVKVLDVDLGRR